MLSNILAGLGRNFLQPMARLIVPLCMYLIIPFPDGNNNNLVEVYSCFGAEWQNWDRVGDTIVNAANGECLDVEGSNAVVRGCDGSDSQNWDMALLALP